MNRRPAKTGQPSLHSKNAYPPVKTKTPPKGYLSKRITQYDKQLAVPFQYNKMGKNR